MCWQKTYGGLLKGWITAMNEEITDSSNSCRVIKATSPRCLCCSHIKLTFTVRIWQTNEFSENECVEEDKGNKSNLMTDWALRNWSSWIIIVDTFFRRENAAWTTVWWSHNPYEFNEMKPLLWCCLWSVFSCISHSKHLHSVITSLYSIQ